MHSQRNARTSLLLFCLIVLISGCSYPEVSPATYASATALYSACNQKNVTRLDMVEQQIAESESAGTLASKEAVWLRDIIALARAGEWQSAAAEARAILNDQIVAQ